MVTMTDYWTVTMTDSPMDCWTVSPKVMRTVMVTTTVSRMATMKVMKTVPPE